MTISADSLLLYAGAVFILFLIPGPVWAAIIARALGGGFGAAWPLALGVVIGDALWTVIAILGVNWLVSLYAGVLILLRYFGAVLLMVMGAQLIRHAGQTIRKDSRLTAPGGWAGFSAGALISIGNPKAMLFYLGVLPGFFDIVHVKPFDVALIALISMLVPLSGNIALAAFLHRARQLISSETGRRRINLASGISLVFVGAVIALT